MQSLRPVRRVAELGSLGVSSPSKIMKQLICRLLVAATVIALVIVALMARFEYRAALAYRYLAQTVSSVTNINVYRFEAPNRPDTEIAFPVDVFCVGGGQAEYRTFTIWKGHCSAVFSLRDGSKREGRFCTHAPMFSFDGVPGVFYIPQPWGSQFSKAFRSTMEEPAPANEHKKNT